jgi:hypothetical protein
MERAAWTDERLDDLARRMDAGFGRVEADVRGLRQELHQEIGGLRGEMRTEMGAMRAEFGGQLEGLRLTILRVGGGMMVGLVGVIAAILARGA